MAFSKTIGILTLSVLFLWIIGSYIQLYGVKIGMTEQKNLHEKSNNNGVNNSMRKHRFISDEELKYNTPPGGNVSFSGGKLFKITKEEVKLIQRHSQKWVNIDESTLKRVVFVTASSSNHFVESLDAVASVQKYYPQYKIYYYDLGLTEGQAGRAKQLCGVSYRVFNFTRYPDKGLPLYTCWWKPLVIHESLLAASGVVWFDASVRFKSDHLLESSLRSLQITGGLALLLKTSHSIYAATYPTTYQYLPMDSETSKKTLMYGGGLLVIMNTEVIYKDILHWWLLCALTEDCIAPIKKKPCHFRRTRNKMSRFANCHRFDQAALSIIVQNKYKVDIGNLIKRGKLFSVRRKALNVKKVCFRVNNKTVYITNISDHKRKETSFSNNNGF